METTSMSGLLQADGERVRNELRAGVNIEKNRESCLKLLSDELGTMLLRYNAAYGADSMRQAVADCVTATARDQLELLLTGEAEKKASHRQQTAGGAYGLLAAVLLCVAAAVLLTRIPIAGYICLACAVLSAYISGRVWYKERQVDVRATLDPERVWDVFSKTAETMDRKIEDFSAQDWIRESKGDLTAHGENAALDRAALELFAGLLEAEYTGSGDFALRQLRKVPPYLTGQGVTLVDYSQEREDLFELFPSKKRTATQRPAILEGNDLLMMGKATVQEE